MPFLLAALVVAAFLAKGCQQEMLTQRAQEKQALRTDAAQQLDALKGCLKQARKTSGAQKIGGAKMIQSDSDPLYNRKLDDPSFAKPEEAEAALQYAIARRPCLGRHIENLSRLDIELAVLRSQAAAASDQDLIDLAAGAITWGELNLREQRRSEKARERVREITQRIRMEQGQKMKAETTVDQRAQLQRQQQANRSLQSWANTQRVINSLRPNTTTITDCVMRDNQITCRPL